MGKKTKKKPTCPVCGGNHQPGNDMACIEALQDRIADLESEVTSLEDKLSDAEITIGDMSKALDDIEAACDAAAYAARHAHP